MYLGIGVGLFDHYCRQGRIESPRVFGPARVWDIRTLQIDNKFTHKTPSINGVYVVGFDTYVKIGFSTDVHRRIGELQIGLPAVLTIYTIIKDGLRRDEGNLHKRFATYRTFGEWFRLGGELKEWIEGGCK